MAELDPRRIRDRSRTDTMKRWLFVVMWNVVAAPLALIFIRTHKDIGWFALLFPLVGIVLFFIVVYETMRAMRFRGSMLVLDSVPAPIGGVLRGLVQVPRPFPEVLNVTLQIATTTQRGSGRSRTETTEVHDERELDPVTVRQSENGTTIPIEIIVPEHVPQTSDRRTWQLIVDAELPGLDYRATFDVPVAFLPRPDVRPHLASVPAGAPRSPRSYVERMGADGPELYFPPFHAREVALWTLLLALFVLADTAFAAAIGAPWPVVLLAALIALVFVYAAIDLLFASRTVRLAPDRIVVQHRLLFASETTIRYDEIASVRAVPAAMFGSRPHHHVVLETKTGKSMRVAWHIRSKREAEWIASRIRR